MWNPKYASCSFSYNKSWHPNGGIGRGKHNFVLLLYHLIKEEEFRIEKCNFFIVMPQIGFLFSFFLEGTPFLLMWDNMSLLMGVGKFYCLPTKNGKKSLW